jgi:hypothetical protein
MSKNQVQFQRRLGLPEFLKQYGIEVSMSATQKKNGFVNKSNV